MNLNNTNLTKSKLIINKIQKKAKKVDIALFIYQEAINFLKTLNFYKLENIEKNIDQFFEYLKKIDNENTENILKISFPEKELIKKCKKKIGYYISKQGQQLLEESGTKIYMNNELNTNLGAIRSYIMLTIMEICYGTQTRLNILKFNKKPIHKTQIQ